MLSMFAGIQYLVFSPLSCYGQSLKRTGLNSCSEPLISNVMWRNIFGQVIPFFFLACNSSLLSGFVFSKSSDIRETWHISAFDHKSFVPVLTSWLGLQVVYQIIVFMTFNFAGKKILKLSGTSDEQTLMNNTVIFNAFVFCQVRNLFAYCHLSNTSTSESLLCLHGFVCMCYFHDINWAGDDDWSMRLDTHFLQVFNEINARRPEKLNVFQGIYKNYVFLLIIGITVVFQVCKNLFLTPWNATNAGLAPHN